MKYRDDVDGRARLAEYYQIRKAVKQSPSGFLR